jgi:penicillin amidase
LLTGDPHLANGIPSTWYLTGLHYDDFYLIGATFPGIPAMLYGRTKDMAWSFTAALTDVSDLFKEKVSQD